VHPAQAGAVFLYLCAGCTGISMFDGAGNPTACTPEFIATLPEHLRFELDDMRAILKSSEHLEAERKARLS